MNTGIYQSRRPRKMKPGWATKFQVPEKIFANLENADLSLAHCSLIVHLSRKAEGLAL